ncbi:hypothetical protein [Streptomyces sp. MJM1172]|uniref:hypothetical protein n=1 Tax=Streptomyces sp. MJM1172 TaxID=1703926 RepID=UPI00116125F6|nr:hypothetical protein [Streptomyces sp. MJM1172]
MTTGCAGAPGGVERGESGTTDVVLRAGGGSWRTVPRSMGNAALTALGTGLLGLALVLPVAVIVLFSGAGWTMVGVMAFWMVSAAVAAGFAGALAAACFRVRRIRFSAAGDPPAVRLVRGLGSGPWRPAEEPDRLRLEQEIEEPYAGDPLPAARVLTLRLIRDDSDVCRAVLPPDIDARQFLTTLEQALGPAVLLELHVKRITRPAPRLRPRRDGPSGIGISGAGGYSCGGGSGCGGGGGGGG